MLRGGGEQAPCDLCARGLYLGQGGDDDAVRERMRAVLEEARKANRICLCRPHIEDAESLGTEFCSPLAEVKPGRRSRRTAAAVVRRAHRASLPRAVPEKPKPQRGGGGGVAF